MTAQLDEELIYRTRRRSRKLTPADRIAINLLKRRHVRVVVLARAFDVSKNTIYAKALGHQAESYHKADIEAAAEADALVEKLGVEKAWKKYVTDEMIEAVNRENRIEAEVRAEAQAARKRAAE